MNQSVLDPQYTHLYSVTMHRPLKIVNIAVCLLFCSISFLHAQQAPEFAVDNERVSERKEPSIFKRPRKHDPAAQLKYADELSASGRTGSAAKQYRALVYKWHDAPEAPVAQMRYAELLVEQGKHEKAFDEFQYLVEHFAGQFPYAKVIGDQFKIANYVMTAKRFDVLFLPGFATPERALPLFEKVVRNAPNWENSAQAQFYIGLINEQIKEYEAAIGAYEVVQSRYSDGEYSASAAFRRARCLYLLANKSPKDELICRKALTALSGYLRDYYGDPNVETATKYTEELKRRLSGMYYDIALFYDKKTDNRQAAIIAYSDFLKKFPSSEKAVEADKRLKELVGQD